MVTNMPNIDTSHPRTQETPLEGAVFFSLLLTLLAYLLVKQVIVEAIAVNINISGYRPFQYVNVESCLGTLLLVLVDLIFIINTQTATSLVARKSFHQPTLLNMLTIHFLIPLFFYHILGVAGGPSPQYCGLDYWQTGDYVSCVNPGGGNYTCPFNRCTTKRGRISTTLFFRHCVDGVTLANYSYVWPTQYSVLRNPRRIEVSWGATSEQYGTPRTMISWHAICNWSSPNDANNVRVSCQGCELQSFRHPS
ncbi:hypothetical protein O181_007711 [Austropuccinia psidii MF-1]|uniref:Uncharacterized protein n=1 Tax=Austropuccinia psidii MF-1 TaxID=1389203 RepID=A0A9Q3GHV0_9BASI|nr:hypothetical protein [Austropuccinia psidii MF-1]